LAPHEIGKAEDGVCLGWTGGLPLVDQSRKQFLKFPRLLARNCRTHGESAVFLCVGAFPLWNTRNGINLRTVTVVHSRRALSRRAISMTAACWGHCGRCSRVFSIIPPEQNTNHRTV